MGGSDRSEEELMALWCAGDRASGEELCLRLNSVLCEWRRRYYPREDIDVVQDVLLRLCRRPEGYGGRCKLRSYVFRMLHHRVIDAERERRRRGPVVPIEEEEVGDDESADEALAAGEGRARVLAAVTALPDDVRHIVELHYWDELTTRQIGETLHRPVGTVKSKLQWARRQMRPGLE